MFERFTKEARRAVVAAQEEARALGHVHVDTSHLLLAMAGGPDTAAGRSLRRLGVGIDGLAEGVRSRDGHAFSGEEAAALRSVGINLEDVQRSVEEAFGVGALDIVPRPNRRVTAHVPLARDAKTALKHALKEAMRLGDRHISTGHLLLALVRDNTSYATLMLARLGLDASRVRDVAEAEIARGEDQRSRSA